MSRVHRLDHVRGKLRIQSSMFSIGFPLARRIGRRNENSQDRFSSREKTPADFSPRQLGTSITLIIVPNGTLSACSTSVDLRCSKTAHGVSKFVHIGRAASSLIVILVDITIVLEFGRPFLRS